MAASCASYGAPAAPSGSAVAVVMASAGTMVMVNGAVSWLPPRSVAVSVKVKVPAVVGVPPKRPVDIQAQARRQAAVGAVHA